MDEITERLTTTAIQAGEAIARCMGGELQTRLKAPHELLTQADELSHGIISYGLTRDFPGVPQILEEQCNTHLPPGPYLVGDELDGTAVFAAGAPDWGVTLARIDGAPTHGVIYLPQRQLLIVARRNAGCWINGRAIRLGACKPLHLSVWGTELNPRVSTSHRRFNDALMDATLTTRCLASSTSGAAELLLGHTDLYLNCGGGKIWDFAAGVLAVEEAGGVALRADGTTIDWRELGMDVLMATSADIANEALALREKCF
jgi:fructose-1,6-bisphosphatase/inositol monophosphatase family enzyme